MTKENVAQLKSGDKIVKTRREIITNGTKSFTMEFPFTDVIESIGINTVRTTLRRIIQKTDLISMFEMRG